MIPTRNNPGAASIAASSSAVRGNSAASSAFVTDKDLSADHPLSTASLLDAAQKGALQLKSPLLSEALAMQIVKNLFFAAKCFDARREEGDKVEEGQTLGAIIEAYNKQHGLKVRLAHVLKANPTLKDPKKLKVGQTIRIPAVK